MPRGPHGEKRPADSVGAAVLVAKIATGEIPDHRQSGRVASGKVGGAVRASALSSVECSDIASKAAKARWENGV